MHKNDRHCRVCSYQLCERPWGADGLSPTWEPVPAVVSNEATRTARQRV